MWLKKNLYPFRWTFTRYWRFSKLLRVAPLCLFYMAYIWTERIWKRFYSQIDLRIWKTSAMINVMCRHAINYLLLLFNFHIFFFIFLLLCLQIKILMADKTVVITQAHTFTSCVRWANGMMKLKETEIKCKTSNWIQFTNQRASKTSKQFARIEFLNEKRFFSFLLFYY